MRLKQIRDFVSVVESGSIRAAARNLGVSQPAITKSVRSLEAELHSQLVQRTPHGVVPTAAGRAFFARARIVQLELRKAEEDVAQLGGDGAGSVAFGVGPASVYRYVSEAVVQFREQFPKAHVRIVEGLGYVLLPQVRNETLDFAVCPRFDLVPDRAVAFRPLIRSNLVVVGRKGHPLRNARSLAQLVDVEWISLLPPGSRGVTIDGVFSSAGLPRPLQRIQCESYNVLVTLLANTDMLGVVSRRHLNEPGACSLLQQIAITESIPALTVGMLTRIDPPLTPVAAAMAKAVVATARRTARTEV